MKNDFSLLILTLIATTATADDGLLNRELVGLRPVLQEYCLGCHSTAEKSGELDLERLKSLASVRKDVEPWQAP